MAVWYYEQGGATYGPFTAEMIRQFIVSGKVARSTQLWAEGFSGWTVAERTEFASAFQAAMPPALSGPPHPHGAYTASDPDRSTVNIIYILYIVGFFVHLTALIGVIMAYVNRATASPLYRSHYDWQIRMFWTGLIAIAVMVGAYVVSIVLTILTGGLWLLTVPLIAILAVAWFVWTIFAIVKGMSALGRTAPVTIAGYW